MRVPLIARWTGKVPSGRVDSTAVLTAVDFLPTIAPLCGAVARVNPSLDGEDMLPALTGKPFRRSKAIHWEWRFTIAGYNVNRSPILSIREGDWKLLFNPDESRVELYNIPADPMEMDNRAAAQTAVVERLKARALAWRKTLPPGPIEPSAGRNDWNWPKAARPD